jgi:hypothetical protein
MRNRLGRRLAQVAVPVASLATREQVSAIEEDAVAKPAAVAVGAGRRLGYMNRRDNLRLWRAAERHGNAAQ